MIWYRHWLELRSMALMVITGAAVLGPLYFRTELFDPRPAFRPDFMFGPLQTLTRSLDTLQLTALARHQEFTWFAILFGSLFLGGHGLRTFRADGSGAAVTTGAQFTLSLPVSRRRIVLTRLAAGYAMAALALTVSLTANAVALVAFERTVPLVPMALATAFATLVILFWIGVLPALISLVGMNWGMSLTLVGMLFSSPFWMYGMSAAAARTLEWPVLLLFGVVLAVTIYMSIAVAASEEV